MRNLILTVSILAGCTSSTGTGDVDAASDAVNNGDGPHSDGNAPSDAPNVSYAPCDTCCDPIAQDCPTGQACYENAQHTGTFCDSVGPRVMDDGCDLGPITNDHCIEGETCPFGGNTFGCRPFCVTATNCPSTHPTCVLYTVTAGYNAYGICF